LAPGRTRHRLVCQYDGALPPSSFSFCLSVPPLLHSAFCLSLLLGILPAHARRVDAQQRMQLPKCRSCAGSFGSEPGEVQVASGVVAMRGSAVAARSVCAGRMPTLRCAQISIGAQHHLRVDLRRGVLTPLPETTFPHGSPLHSF